VKLGCERKGSLTDKFKVNLLMTRDGKTSDTSCSEGPAGLAPTELSIFQKFEVGQTYKATSRMGYGLLCSSIQFPDRLPEKRLARDKKAYNYGEFVEFYGSEAADYWAAAHPVAHNKEL